MPHCRYLLHFLSDPAAALVKKAKPAESAKLTGFAFLVTKGGDLKPARLASVTVLYMMGPGEEYMRQKVGLLSARSEHRVSADEDLCQAWLMIYRVALESTMKWAGEQGKSGQVKTVDADEEGHFTISGLPVGAYILIVSGQAGMNSAFWENDDVVVKTGQTTSVKVSSPIQACLAQ